MRATTIALSIFAFTYFASAETVKIKVNQDTWFGPLDAGTALQDTNPTALRVATPANSEAHLYYRRAIFGFDLSTINLKKVNSVTFTATTSKGIDSAYDNGKTFRAYLVSNAIADRFSQSTATEKSLIAAGFFKDGYVLGSYLAATPIGDYTTSGGASEQTVNFEFSAEAIADLKKDSNQFAAIIVENRTGSNAGFTDSILENAGFAFQSLETPGGKPAELSVSVEAAESNPVLLSIGGISIELK